MKSLLFRLLVLSGLLTAFLFIGCKPKPKTLDQVLKQLPAESYSLNFQDLALNDPVIKQASYGKRPEGLMYEIDEICPQLKKIGYKYIPPIIVPPRTFAAPTLIKTTLVPPIFPQPTCPDYVRFAFKESILKVINQSGWKYAKEIQTIKAGDLAVLITKGTLADFQNIQPDRMDLEGMKGVDLDQVFVLMPEMAQAGAVTESGGDYFGRGWYGQRFGKLVLPPKYIGCFDPIYLNILRENLIRYNQVQFSTLKVKELDAAAKTGTLGF